MKIWTLRVILWSHLESLLSLLVCFGDHPVSQQTLNRVITIDHLCWYFTVEVNPCRPSDPFEKSAPICAN